MHVQLGDTVETSLPPAEWGCDVELEACSEGEDEGRRRSIGKERSASPEQLQKERELAIQMEIEREEEQEREEHETAKAVALQREKMYQEEQREAERVREFELRRQIEVQLRRQREEDERIEVERRQAEIEATRKAEAEAAYQAAHQAEASLLHSMSEMVGEQSRVAVGQIQRMNTLIEKMEERQASRDRERNMIFDKFAELEHKIERLSPKRERQQLLPCTPRPCDVALTPPPLSPPTLDCRHIYFEVPTHRKPYYWHVLSGAVQWSRPSHPSAYVLPHNPDVIKMVTQMMRFRC